MPRWSLPITNLVIIIITEITEIRLSWLEHFRLSRNPFSALQFAYSIERDVSVG